MNQTLFVHREPRDKQSSTISSYSFQPISVSRAFSGFEQAPRSRTLALRMRARSVAHAAARAAPDRALWRDNGNRGRGVTTPWPACSSANIIGSRDSVVLIRVGERSHDLLVTLASRAFGSPPLATALFTSARTLTTSVPARSARVPRPLTCFFFPPPDQWRRLFETGSVKRRSETH